MYKRQHLERLKDYQPTIVVAPASTLIELANFVSNQQLAIQPVKVVSVAEILEDRDAPVSYTHLRLVETNMTIMKLFSWF